MTQKLVIFDMDNVMWNLDERVAKRKDIDCRKFTVYSAYDNENLTDMEKNRVITAYTETETYMSIVFYKKIVDLINKIHNEHPEYLVQIVSNCATEAIRDVKMTQLLNVLDLHERDIHLHVINIKTGSKHKELPKDIFMIVDDSPYNIMNADARHKIMPAKPYNTHIQGYGIDCPKTNDELVKTVMCYIDKN